MNIREFNWSPNEKKIARTAFNVAFEREMDELKNELKKRVSQINSNEDVWKLHNYLTKRRDRVDEKYDYRYSKLITVFSILVEDGYLKLEDLRGLSDDKIEVIQFYTGQ